MARGDRRSNREPKKPKQNKPKAAPSVSPFAATSKGFTAPQQPTPKKK